MDTFHSFILITENKKINRQHFLKPVNLRVSERGVGVAAMMTHED